MKQGRCSQAIEHFRTVLALQPDYREAHLHLASCYRITGDEERARAEELNYRSGD